MCCRPKMGWSLDVTYALDVRRRKAKERKEEEATEQQMNLFQWIFRTPQLEAGRHDHGSTSDGTSWRFKFTSRLLRAP
jgi:hypothetical protein